MKFFGLALLLWLSSSTCRGQSVAESPPPWNGAAVSDWLRARDAVVLTDMTTGGPAGAFAATSKRGRWLAIPYEMQATSGGHRGVAAWCGYEAEPPELVFRPGVTGWHAVFVGVPAGCGIWMRLDTDRAARWRSNTVRDHYVNSQDMFFKVARLTEASELRVQPQRHGTKHPAGVSHITLIPLTDSESARWTRDRADPTNRTMAATFDGFSSICAHSPRTREEILREIEEFRDSDVGTLLLHGGWSGDKTIYPSEVGHLPGGDLEDVAEPYHRGFIEATQALAAQKINPLVVLIDGAHEMGLKVHVGVRPAGWSYFQPYNGLWDSPFYLDHPEWRCIDRADLGAPELTRMSWAVPEVRKHLIDLLMEQVGFGADGAHVVFNRGVPVVLYERPFCDIFIDRHGVDPNELDDEDPRIWSLRAEIVGTFFRELRVRLDGVERTRREGGRLTISATVLGTEANNLQYGIDVAALCRDRLLDAVYVYPFDFGATKGAIYDAAYFSSACKKHSVPHFPAIPPPYELEAQPARVLDLYEGGGAGITFWDAGGVDPLTWAVQSRYGHREETRWRKNHVDLKHPPHALHFYKWWGAQRMDVRFPPFWGG